MEMQSVCLGISAPKPKLFDHRLVCRHSIHGGSIRSTDRRACVERTPTSLMPRLKEVLKDGLGRGATLCVSRGRGAGLVVCRAGGVEPFRGKSGSVSFHGLTHQLVEEAKLESAPFEKDKGSYLWLLAPAALISSLILPQFFLGNAVEAYLKNETLVEIVTSLSFDAMFYFGLMTFLLVTDRVQRPYLQFSPKRWSLITGLRGYLSSAFFTMGFKVVIPVFTVYITWPVVGLPSLIAVAPFLIGCLAQLIFEKSLEKSGSSCWPLVPILFEVYRFYQLTKAAHYIERLMFAMKDLPTSPEVLDRSGALVATIVSFQILGLLCLWSLITFLLRLFPSRPVSENY
ncbi:uncharacterized protein LOC104448701 [Eucalyptus grandis]|uniref:Uncharacterized protein n=2 Tax=Eucalyptus grandis TaxID=71139 RepID=A0ACC3KEJ0_EUCGR|nr:uncharacterized protein LOC104448701 [Eucalyptus grandis]KAK3424735.1 hypothetical protein EUGRSUZ_F01506 [Eucalyptus grandis]